MLILLTFQHALLFLYLVLIAGLGNSPVSFADFSALRAFIWFCSVFIGGWWGVWLGLGWYKLVYEDVAHKGLVHSLAAVLYKLTEPAPVRKQTPLTTAPSWNFKDIDTKPLTGIERAKKVIVRSAGVSKPKAKPRTLKRAVVAAVEVPKKVVKKTVKTKRTLTNLSV